MQKIVDFEWCKKCEHYNVVDWDDPCDECLNSPTNEDSHRPVYFKDRNGTDNKTRKASRRRSEPNA